MVRAETAIFEACMNGLDSEGTEIPRDLIRLSYPTSVRGYGSSMGAVMAVIDARVGQWKGLPERYGGERLKENLPN
jgi:hypothetical protein|tara:strand:+ start:355 stop:582 length:228 start_codon:yes stop_codon:yes gene_type:complete